MFAKVVSGDTEKDTGIRRLKRELARVFEKRDILKSYREFRQGCKVSRAVILPVVKGMRT